MDRFRDYLGFVVQFVGVGYIALWPLSTPGPGELFGAALVCHGGVAGMFDLVCGLPHPLRLSLGLHAVGALCAVLATLHMFVVAIRRTRRQRVATAIEAPADEAGPAPALTPWMRLARLRHRRRPLPPPRKYVRRRSQFGLRGVPQ